MGLHRFKPLPSGRMGILWTLSSIRDAAVVEFGCMGHMMYSGVTLENTGVRGACKRYSTHIDETDIALGGMDKLAHTVAHVVERDNPRVIFLLPSSIPEVIGTDLRAEAKALQREYPDTLFLTFGQGGFEVTQHRGVQEALLRLVQALPRDTDKTPQPTFNVIGSCADLFRFQADAGEILRIMQGAFGMKPLCILTSDTSVQDIENMGGAHINLVLRREGGPAALDLQKRFGTPYLMGRPYGIDGTAQWIEEAAKILKISADRDFMDGQLREGKKLLSDMQPLIRHLKQEHTEEIRLSIGAHADVVRGILDFGCKELVLPKGYCWCESPDMAGDEVPYFTEDQWIQAIQSQKKGLLMASGEALAWADRNMSLQIANPDTKRRLNPYVPPFVGFRGALHLMDLWINAALEQEDDED
ncbi:MAG: nitrogenase component 1 [Lacrimispora sp.]|uniref:nitrogenase component 1 n=1 Tax=Lacrimispora sp. TaxID=2719234 RepID=UPI0039E4F9B1